MIETLEKPARQRWSTADVESRHALAYWVDTICESFLEIDIDSPDREQFRAQLDQSELGAATLHLLEADTQTIRRTPARIACSKSIACEEEKDDASCPRPIIPRSGAGWSYILLQAGPDR